MKNRTKNILSFMLAFIMVLSVSINVFAASRFSIFTTSELR